MTTRPSTPNDFADGAASSKPDQPVDSVPKRVKAIGGLQVASPIPGKNYEQ